MSQFNVTEKSRQQELKIATYITFKFRNREK